MTETRYTVMVGEGQSHYNSDHRECMSFGSVHYILTSYNFLDAGQLAEVLMDHSPQSDAWVVFKAEGDGFIGYDGIIGNFSEHELAILPGVTLAPGQGYDTVAKKVVTASLDNA